MMNPDDLVSVMDKQDMVRDQIVQEQSPVGRFSASSINSLVVLANKVLGLTGAPYTVERFTGTPNEKVALPSDLVKALTVTKQMIEAYNESGPDEPLRTFDITSSVSDSDLAMIGLALDGLLKSIPFKKFLKTQAPAESETQGQEIIEDAPRSPSTPRDLELSLLK